MNMDRSDIIIVGGGPAGLTAAKVAAEKGLRVVLVEMKKDIAKITRTCAQIFYLKHIGGGQTYIKPVRVEIESGKKSRLSFPDINFSVEYGGNLRACYDWRNLSPDGTCVYTARNKLWGFVLNKEVLLQGLLDEIHNLGVTILYGAQGIRSENTGKGVMVEVKDSGGMASTLEADYAIIANSVNSRIVEKLGLNKTRQSIGGMTISILGYIMEGITCPYPPSSWVSFAYPSLSSFINIWMGPMADGQWQVGTTEKVPGSPLELMNRFLSHSTFAPWFAKARIIHKTVCSIIPRYPIAEPVVGNIMVIGDAAAPAETWIQGAIACGHQAVNALCEGNMGKYVAWWKESFLFNSPDYYRDLARYPALNVFFNDDELNYLYGLIKDQLVSNILDELLKYTDRIKVEQPEIYEKLKNMQNLSLKDTFKNE
jgi:flavin-dependent dehydrogenase